MEAHLVVEVYPVVQEEMVGTQETVVDKGRVEAFWVIPEGEAVEEAEAKEMEKAVPMVVEEEEVAC